MVTFSTNEPVVNPTVTILGHTLGLSGNGAGPYTANYTLVSGDPQGELTATIAFTDASGNAGNATVNITGSGSNATTSAVGGYITVQREHAGRAHAG